jgi:3-deoxy-7-phosphoheptulonate synthase
VTPVALAAAVAGAHGLLIEVNLNPDVAKCDGDQTLTFENFHLLMAQVNALNSVRKAPAPAQLLAPVKKHETVAGNPRHRF